MGILRLTPAAQLLPRRLRVTSGRRKTGAVSLPLLVLLFPRAMSNNLQPVPLLPRGRLTTTVLPVIGCASGATRGGNDLGSSVIGKGLREGHGEIIGRKNKSAMPKIILAIRRQCRHSSSMKTTYLIQFELDGAWITCATRKTYAAAKAKAKAERKAMNGAHETAIIREGDPEILRRKTCEQFQLA